MSNYLLTSEALKQVMETYEVNGYYVATDKVNELYSEDKISLIQKSKLTNELTTWQMMTSKQRKWQKKL